MFFKFISDYFLLYFYRWQYIYLAGGDPYDVKYVSDIAKLLYKPYVRPGTPPTLAPAWTIPVYTRYSYTIPTWLTRAKTDPMIPTTERLSSANLISANLISTRNPLQSASSLTNSSSNRLTDEGYGYYNQSDPSGYYHFVGLEKLQGVVRTEDISLAVRINGTRNPLA